MYIGPRPCLVLEEQGLRECWPRLGSSRTGLHDEALPLRLARWVSKRTECCLHRCCVRLQSFPIVSATRYGAGRAMALGHESLFPGSSDPGWRRFLSNSMFWLAGGQNASFPIRLATLSQARQWRGSYVNALNDTANSVCY